MTREEAKLALQQGHKITHRYFDDNEYVYHKKGLIYDELGYYHEEFWELRTEHWWNDGWRIFEEK
jgi:hypothetical protein